MQFIIWYIVYHKVMNLWRIMKFYCLDEDQMLVSMMEDLDGLDPEAVKFVV